MVDIGMADIYDKMARDYVEPDDLAVDEIWPLFQVGIALTKIKYTHSVRYEQKEVKNHGVITNPSMIDMHRAFC